MSGKYALIIGNREYIDPGLAQLSAPGKDAEDFARILKDKEIGAFDNVTVLLDQLSSTISEAIDEFFDQKKPDDLLVLYFSGHGVRDEYGSLYLAVKNTIRSRLRSTSIKSDYVRDAMEQSRSKRQVLILDCCNSGAFPQGVKAELGGVMGMTVAFQGYGRYVLTASDATQFAWDGDQVIGEIENSLFTHFLIKGLEGEADSDGDGTITVDELYDYAYEQICSITPKQTPTKSASKQEGEIILRQTTKIENIKPIALPDELTNEVQDTRPYVREVAVQNLEKILKGKNLRMARSAREALEKIAAEDDSRRVAQAAKQALDSVKPADPSTADTEVPLASRTSQLRREKLEQERLFKTEQTRLLQEKAELEKRLNEERIAREKADAERKAQEEIARLAREKIEASKVQAYAQPARSRWIPFGVAVAIIGFIGVCGFAAANLAPMFFKPTATESPKPSMTITEAIPATSEPIVVTATPGVTETTVLIETTVPTESITETPNGLSDGLSTEINDSKNVVMVLIPSGTFSMGTNKGNADEAPVHTVNLESYYIDKFEVTNARYGDCVNAGECKKPVHSYFFAESPYSIYFGNPQYDQYPVIYVDWDMAKAYCTWRDARLPTEAEWEKAARGTNASLYPWDGNDLACQNANYQRCVNRTDKVGSYEAGKSPYNVYDMAGNVWEWVADWYSESYYQNSLSNNPMGPNSGKSRVLRGGSWTQYDVRVTNRNRYAHDYTSFDIGIRCVADPPK